MKKILLGLYLFIIPCLVFAQHEELEVDSAAAEIDYTSEICGIEFGTSFEATKKMLIQKFGDDYSLDGNNLFFSNKEYAGIMFDAIIFGFQRNGFNSYFNKCVFCLYASNASEAIKKRDYLYKVLNEKYYIKSKIGEDKFKYYQGGTSPVSDEDWGFSIDVFHFDKHWSARLFYGPYNYVKEEF